MTDTTPKQYSVTVIEVIVHTRTVTAANERDANDIVRFHWDEVGADGFDTQSLGCTELLVTDEVQP